MGEGQQAEKVVTVRPDLLLNTLRRPRVLLILLAAWAILGALTEIFSDSFLLELNLEADGVLGGRALGGEAIALAALYLYAAHAPERYRFVLWVALVEQVAAVPLNFYHWGADDFGFESVVLPIAVALVFLFLLIPYLIQPRWEALPTAAKPSGAEESQQL